MSSLSFRQSITTKSCLDGLDFICNRLALWYKRQLVTANGGIDTLPGFSKNATRTGLVIAREKRLSFRCFWLFPRPLKINPTYVGAMIRAFDTTKTTFSNCIFALGRDTSGHDLRDLMGIMTRSRSPPLQLRPCLHAGGNPSGGALAIYRFRVS